MKKGITIATMFEPAKILSLREHIGLRIVETNLKSSQWIIEKPLGRMALSTRGKIELIDLADILYVEAESNYIRIYFKEAGSIMVAKTLKQISTKLSLAGFLRVHQSFMIHPVMIRSYDTKAGILMLTSGAQIPVSRANRKMVTGCLMKWSC